MEIEDIKKTMGDCADKLEDLGYLKLSQRLNLAEKAIEDESGITWTLGDNLAQAVKWFIAQMQGDSGTGETYWEQFEEYLDSKKSIAEWDAQKPKPSRIERELSDSLEEMLRRSYNEMELRNIARDALAKWKGASK